MREEEKTCGPPAGESQESERGRRLKEDLLRALTRAVENMQLGLTITDTTGKILYTNPSEASMHGYSVGELIGKDVRVLAPDELRKPMTPEAMKEIRSWTRECVNVRKDGSIFPVQLMSDVVLNEEGVPIGIVTTCEDISARKAAEKALLRERAEMELRIEDRTAELQRAILKAEEERSKSEAIIAALGDGISIQDRHFRVLYQNKIHRDLAGDCAGEYCYQAYSGVDAVCDGCPVAMSFEDGLIHKLEKKAPAGRKITHVEITASPLRDASGHIIAGIELVRDISQRKKSEEERERLIAELQEALAKVRTLSGLLPICAWCGKTRDDKGYWNALEAYIEKHSDARFTHGICPECLKEVSPELTDNPEFLRKIRSEGKGKREK